MTRTAEGTTASWRDAGESGDRELATACLAEDVQIISPLTAHFRFRGRDQASELLDAVFTVISDITFHTEVGDERTRALFLRGRCGREEFEEAQLLRFDDEGLIGELTLYGRPLPGVTAVMAAIGPVLVSGQQRRVLAKLLAVAGAPLAFMARVGDARLVPLADPNRP